MYFSTGIVSSDQYSQPSMTAARCHARCDQPNPPAVARVTKSPASVLRGHRNERYSLVTLDLRSWMTIMMEGALHPHRMWTNTSRTARRKRVGTKGLLLMSEIEIGNGNNTLEEAYGSQMLRLLYIKKGLCYY